MEEELKQEVGGDKLEKINEAERKERAGGLLDPELLKIGTPLTNLKQELFCQLYATDREFFGNGTQAYIEAYNPVRRGNWYNAVRASASDLLTSPNILKRINELLEADGFNDVFADKQLKFLMTQMADLPTKRAAVNDYNKLKARITEKMDVMSDGKSIGVMIYKPEKLKQPDEQASPDVS